VRKPTFLLLLSTLILASCAYDNEQEMFPHVVIPDSIIRGQVAWFTLDSELTDKLGQVDPLRFWGSLEWSRDHSYTDNAALNLDGVEDYLSGYLGVYDSLAVSLWFMPLPNYRKAYLFDYGIGRFAAGLDAISSATMPAFNLFIQNDTSTYVLPDLINYFYWHHLYMEIGDSLVPPRFFIDGFRREFNDTIRRMHPLTDLFYLGRPCNADILDESLYRGMIDEIRIFNTFLTEDEINSLYWEGKAGHL